MFSKALLQSFMTLLLGIFLTVNCSADTVVVGEEHIFGPQGTGNRFHKALNRHNWPETSDQNSATIGKRANYRALLPNLKRLKRSSTGYILYTHYDTVKETILGKEISIPITRIHIMDSNRLPTDHQPQPPATGH